MEYTRVSRELWDGETLGLGLVEIMRDFLVAIAFLGLFLIIAALSFYQKRKPAARTDASPGDQEENLFLVFAGRTAGMLCTAYLCAAMVGTVLLFFLRNGVAPWMPECGIPGFVSFFVTGCSLVVLALVCFVAYLTCMELGSRQIPGVRRTAGKNQWEVPG